ncbi:hypothetical protein SDC9_196248 [bioreactor metagenome]|uniref:Uncharacterized protein n=1 Tax=bioreactor metagenome TaxID=1076179 RepID=A0A645IBM6_9ZZZZ
MGHQEVPARCGAGPDRGSPRHGFPCRRATRPLRVDRAPYAPRRGHGARRRLHRGHRQRLAGGRLPRRPPRREGTQCRGAGGVPGLHDHRTRPRPPGARPVRPPAGAAGALRLGDRRLPAGRPRHCPGRLRRCRALGHRCQPRVPGRHVRRGGRPGPGGRPVERRQHHRLHRLPRRPAAAGLPR